MSGTLATGEAKVTTSTGDATSGSSGTGSSGTGVYTTTIDASADRVGADRGSYLELGRVEGAVQVYLNGERVVSVISSRPVSGAVSSATVRRYGLPPRAMSIWAVPPSGRVAKR